MSIANLHAALSRREPTLLMPIGLPTEELILLVKLLAKRVDGYLSKIERDEIDEFIDAYIQLILGMQSEQRLESYLNAKSELNSKLMAAIFFAAKDEIVSRLIGYPVNREKLAEQFNRYFQSS
jgi:hypothetical protein